MNPRLYRILDLTPRHVRTMVKSRDARGLNQLANDLAWVVQRFRSSRAGTKAPRGLHAHIEALLLEAVRTPLLHPMGGKPTVLDIARDQRYLWYTLIDLRPGSAIPVAMRWCRSRKAAARLQGVEALCTLAPQSKLPLVLRSMVDRDAAVAKEAINGVSDAMSKGRLTKAAIARVMSVLRDVMEGKHDLRGPQRADALGAAADVLARQPGGLAHLCSRSVICAGNSAIREALLECTSPTHRRDRQFQAQLRKHLDSAALWRVYNAWKAGNVLVSRKKVWDDSLDDQVAGMLLHLLTIRDPERAAPEIAAQSTIRRSENTLFGLGLEEAEKVLRRGRRM